MPFPSLPDDLDLEAEVARRWTEHDVPARALASHPDGPTFVFYEGPPTANGRPAIHHVFSRTLKDAVCRYRQMTGCHVPRKAGWDTQGLPVEIEVQKELGISTRDEIEAIGVAEFNERCRQSVFTYKGEWEKLSRRMAYWLDYEHPYVTYESGYIQSCWAILSRFHAEGLLEKDFKSLPFCPRCSTGLSNHEVALGYETVQDPSIFVRFGVDADDLRTAFAAATTDREGVRAVPSLPPELRLDPGFDWDAVERLSLLVWTTTPWTLFSNAAAAADADLTYVLTRLGDEHLVLAEARVPDVLGQDAVVLARFPGRVLEGLRYRRPLDDISLADLGESERAVVHTVRLVDFVTADDGTGLVHIAPAFGADDFAVRRRDGLPLLHAVDDQGQFTEAVASCAGRFVKDCDKQIIRVLIA